MCGARIRVLDSNSGKGFSARYITVLQLSQRRITQNCARLLINLLTIKIIFEKSVLKAAFAEAGL